MTKTLTDEELTLFSRLSDDRYYRLRIIELLQALIDVHGSPCTCGCDDCKVDDCDKERGL